MIDQSNSSGSLEFSVAGHASDFFPVNVSFVSPKSYCDIQIGDVVNAENTSEIVKHSADVVFTVDKYEIV